MNSELGADLVNKPTGRFDATILFCDIRGFTSMFDCRDPLDALQFAGVVLAELGRVVENFNGVLDKFTGDGFLAYFGIVSGHDTHPADACRCAIALRLALTKINSDRYLADQPIVSVGIGIHSGAVAAGTITTNKFSEYTVLGTVVNIASRLESLTKFYSVDCLVTHATVAKLDGQFLFQKMPSKPLRGITETITPFWLLPMNN